MRRLLIAAVLLVAGIALAAAQVNFNFTVGSPPPPPPPPFNGCASVAVPSGFGTCVFNWTVDFDNNCTGGCPASGTQVTLPVAANIFNDPSIGQYQSDMYWDYVANAQCYPTYPGGISANCTPTQTNMFQIVANGKSGRGLQVTYKANSIGYNGPCCGQNPQLSLLLNPAYNIIDVQWDEYLVPGFSVFNQGAPNYSITKHGLLVTFGVGAGLPSSSLQTMLYGNTNGSAAFEWINMGDGGVNQVTVESGGYCTEQAVGQWYHFETQIALGPNGWIRAWMTTPSGARYQYDNWPASAATVNCPGGVGGQAGGYENAASSSTDPISTSDTTTLNALTNNFGNRKILIDNHFGGGSTQQAAKVDSFVIYDNIHVTAYKR